VMFNAANSRRRPYVSPVSILEEIEELIKQTSVYEFLRHDPMTGGYNAFPKLIEQVKERLLDRIDDDVRSSLGLVEESEYERVFDRYVDHVLNWTKKEKVRNQTTGREEDPDESMMKEVETTLEVGSDPKDFRHDLISKIGAWSLDNPDLKPDYKLIFADYFRKLRQAYFERQKKTVSRGVDEILVLLTDGKGLTKDGQKRAEAAVSRLEKELGYSAVSARDLVQLLYRNRYFQG
jgi:serine protein kinase